MALREHDSNAPASPEDAKLAALTAGYLQNPASQSQWDALTKELIDGVVNNNDSRHIGQLIFGSIAAYNDGGYFDGKKNTEASAKNELRGELPEHAEKVIVRGGSMSVMNEGQTNQVVSVNSSTRSAFALSGIAAGFDIVPVGEQLPFTGFGPTPKDALQSGLEGATGFFGDDIKTDTSLETKIVDGDKRPSEVTEKFNQNISSLVGHPFHSYRMTESKKRPDGMYEITLMVQPGHIIETNIPAEINIVKQPKD